MMNNKITLLIATKNAGKVAEMRQLLANSSITPIDLNAFPNIAEPVETGATFHENAILKAKYYALQTGIRALADDSGLEVEALNGAPGVRSARYAGAEATNEMRIEKLLAEIENTGDSNRRARFVCTMAIADETGGVLFTSEGFCKGIIASKPDGEHGFGYDPIFVPDGFSETFGRLPNSVKQRISHRKQAIVKIIQQIRRFNGDLT